MKKKKLGSHIATVAYSGATRKARVFQPTHTWKGKAWKTFSRKFFGHGTRTVRKRRRVSRP